MKQNIQASLMILGVLLFLSLPIACTVYKWGDCRKVGHSVLYCIMDVSR